MPANLKKQVRDAAITLLTSATSAKSVLAYTGRIMDTDELPSIHVSCSTERNETGETNRARPILVSLIVRIVGMADTDPDSSAEIVDTLDALEAEVTAALDNGGQPDNDPLGLGAMLVYFDNSEEPQQIDELQELVMVLQTTYGVQFRVQRDDLTSPV